MIMLGGEFTYVGQRKDFKGGIIMELRIDFPGGQGVDAHFNGFTVQTDPDIHMVQDIDLEIQVPSSFPQQYHEVLVRSAELCAVKKTP